MDPVETSKKWLISLISVVLLSISCQNRNDKGQGRLLIRWHRQELILLKLMQAWLGIKGSR
jgi:hypothetical protein